jgi:hypothetical protein
VRLQNVDSGHRFLNALFLSFIRYSSKTEPVGVLKTLHYRSDFWGRPYSLLLQDVMRGPSDWSPGERELFAALTAKLSDCEF